MKNKFQFAMTLAVVLAMLVTSLALADNVINDVTGSGTSTINTGDSTTVNYQLKALNDPSDPGSNKCNTTDGTPTLITILIPAGADVTATPASFTFTSCGTDVPVLFTSNTPGDYVINVDTTDTNDPDSAFNVVTAKFTLHVESLPPPSNTAPELTIPDSFSVEGNATGGANVSYSATATDAQQGSLTPSCSPASGAFFPLGTKNRPRFMGCDPAW